MQIIKEGNKPSQKKCKKLKTVNFLVIYCPYFFISNLLPIAINLPKKLLHILIFNTNIYIKKKKKKIRKTKK